MTPEEETFEKLKEPTPGIDEYGTKRYYNEKGEKHRDFDLPAVIYKFGSKFWYKNGKRHRENGPVIIWSNGNEEFWANGEEIK